MYPLQRGVVCVIDARTRDRTPSAPTSRSPGIELEAGESATFILGHLPGEYQMHGHDPQERRELFERTVNYWRGLLSQSRYRGRWRETVHLSALTLKLLT